MVPANDALVMVLEYANGGDLLGLLRKKKRLSEMVRPHHHPTCVVFKCGAVVFAYDRVMYRQFTSMSVLAARILPASCCT